MFWQSEEEKQALSDFRAHNRKIKVLEQELFDFKQIQQSPTPEVGSWALQMIKSIEHELDQLKS